MNRINTSLDPQPVNVLRVSWGAVFVGLLLAMMTYLFLGVLGTAIGASALDPMGERNPLAGFGTGAGIWVGVSTLVSLAVGGFFAGRSSPRRGALHGVLCWSLTTLVTLYILSSLAGGAIGTASGVARAGLSVAGQGVAAAAPGIASGVKGALKSNGIDIDMTDVQGQLETLLRQTGKPALDPSNLKASALGAASDGTATAAGAAAKPQNSADDLSSFFDRLKQKAYPALDATDKEALVNVIMARTGKSRPEAQTIANNYEQTYNQALEKYRSLKIQAEQKARQAGEAAATGVSHAAWAGVVILLLGALVSGFAGFLGRRSNPLREEVVV
ncbi:hypothetical protein AX768_25935 [Burkholderia sp. PAMC 28687]|jgi:ElaB/YqjD/DUF883 family membrane-anchored ribosome-binding protein|uniref:YrzE family protein n=1 Tax=Burkholderiaceae TaxID=119060 RepID=UPI0007827152|nr:MULTISPECIES: YrzE family protein [Burkholderiaceae]AMM17625.1 hypothetical protein AX768_25935 [Burkholderia sp. PAMC 28687]